MSSSRVERALASLILLSLPVLFGRARGAASEFPGDFAVNWTAAQALRRGISLYDRERLRALGVELIGPRMRGFFGNTFDSYVGPPTTAYLFVPFTAFEFERSTMLYRACAALGFALAAALCVLALPAGDRKRGALLGTLFLTTSFAVPVSVSLGQLDAFIALALAAGLWAVRRRKGILGGASFGLAALLKVSPGLVLACALLRRQRTLALTGAVTILGFLGAAEIASRGETATFLGIVAPQLSRGSFGMDNQSLPGWISRLVLPYADLTDFLIEAGGVSRLAPLIAAVLLGLVFLRMRRRPFEPFEVCLVILAGLLAGPLTWTQYTSWGLIFAVSLAERSKWQGLDRAVRRRALGLVTAGWVLLALRVYLLPHRFDPTKIFEAASVSAHGWLRLLSGAQAFGLLTWFVAGLVLIGSDGLRRPASVGEATGSAPASTPRGSS